MLPPMRLRTRDDLREWIAADLRRYELGTGAARWVALLRTPQARWQVRLRTAEFAANQPGGAWRALGALLRWRLQVRAIRLGYTIPVNVVGPGLKLPAGAPWSSARRPAWGRAARSTPGRRSASTTVTPRCSRPACTSARAPRSSAAWSSARAR